LTVQYNQPTRVHFHLSAPNISNPKSIYLRYTIDGSAPTARYGYFIRDGELIIMEREDFNRIKVWLAKGVSAHVVAGKP
jgi:hypothetical protein